VTIGYHSAENKGFGFKVNAGPAQDGTFTGTGAGWGAVSAGKFVLPQGDSTATVLDGWGYFQVDYIDVAPASAAPPKPPPSAALCNPAASASARKLMEYLVGGFGKRVLAGVQVRDSQLAATEFVHKATGKRPALVEGGLLDYSPSMVARGANATGLVEAWGGWAADPAGVAGGRGLLALCWHWNSPCALMDTGEHPDPAHPW
jgi:mannan endo-1,4-beta-mannosidase